MWIARLAAAALVVAVFFAPTARAQSPYPVTIVDQMWHDDNRNRDVPVRIRIPQARNANEKFPIIIFSHALGGSREEGERWGEYWAANGYYVVHVQHRGSDEELWKAAEDRIAFLKNLSASANLSQLIDRVFDIQFVLNEASIKSEFARADFTRVGMSGHSFGAYTTQALVGQKVARRMAPKLNDARIKAAIAFSPSVRNRVDAESQFEDVTVPFMSVTGTLDGEESSITFSPDERTRPFYALPPGQKYLLVFKDGDHAVFAGRAQALLDRKRAPEAVEADARIVRATQVLTLAFWDAYLKGNANAERWLVTQSRRMLGPRDRFERR